MVGAYFGDVSSVFFPLFEMGKQQGRKDVPGFPRYPGPIGLGMREVEGSAGLDEIILSTVTGRRLGIRVGKFDSEWLYFYLSFW